jgi:hypothetical protein
MRKRRVAASFTFTQSHSDSEFAASRALFAFIAAAGVAAFACSGSPPPDNGPDYQVQTATPPPSPYAGTGTDDNDAGPAPTTPAPTVPNPADASTDAQPASVTEYAGPLASSDTVQFGQDPDCIYNVTLKNIVVDMTVDTGEVKHATVTDTMVEGLVSSCQHGPQPLSDQMFSFSGATKTTNGVEVTFRGSSSNRPETALTLDLPALSANGSPGGYDATLTWHRTDVTQYPDLQWTVIATVHLAPK